MWNSTSNPLIWQGSNQITFPNLLPVAMKYLGPRTDSRFGSDSKNFF